MIQALANPITIDTLEDIHAIKYKAKYSCTKQIEDEDTDAETSDTIEINQRCSICQDFSDTIRYEQECQFCGFKMCSLCHQFLVGNFRSNYKQLARCFNTQCKAPIIIQSWYSKVSQGLSNDEDFIINHMIPNEEARNYFKSNNKLKLKDFKKITRESFKCQLCLEFDIPYGLFQFHYEQKCEKYPITCVGCKQFTAP